MLTETIEARGHTTSDGVLNLSIQVGLVDVDVSVVMRVKPVTPARDVDENGWPLGFFEQVAGSMPHLQRAPQGQSEDRLAFE